MFLNHVFLRLFMNSWKKIPASRRAGLGMTSQPKFPPTLFLWQIHKRRVMKNHFTTRWSFFPIWWGETWLDFWRKNMARSSPQIDWEAPRASDSPFLQGLRVVRDLPRRADGGGDSYRIWPLIMMQTPWKMEMLAKIKCSWSTLKTSFLQYKGMNKLQLSKNLSSQNSASLHVFQLFFHFAQAITGIFCLTGGQFVGGIAHGQAKGWKGRLRGVNL